MIAKPRSIPIEILILEAIVRRLPPLHPRKTEYEKKLYRKRAGFKGELILDYYMTQIQDEDFTILQDLRIPYNGTYFQIDTLLISPFFLLVIDAKNYAGTLEFQVDFNQLIRTLNDIVEVFADPIVQTKLQVDQLKKFLFTKRISPPPIEFLVALSNQNSLIKNPANDREVAKRVIRSSSISLKILPFQAMYRNPFLSQKEIKKLVTLLIKNHIPFVPDIASMNLPLDEMKKGVQCIVCETIGMKWENRTWICNNCGCSSKTAHIAAVKDYFLLYGHAISNKQFREYLNIDSIHLAKRLLRDLNLHTSGSKKGRVYHPDKSFFEESEV